ncbi:MAG: aldo/keto reductase [Micropruina sp.]|nr:aldo/keto reductase [Micropruina sp.]
MAIPTIPLNDGRSIPQVGLGTYLLKPEDTVAAVSTAIELGYRHVDTAAIYGNERQVGQAIRESGLPREEFFVTTKLWNDRHDDAAGALGLSLSKLGLDYVDLYLIHWPVPRLNLHVTAWQSLIELRSQGLTRSIGVSNFLPHHLADVVATGVTPAVNQVEVHPTLTNLAVLAANDAAGVKTEAWAPLGQADDLTIPTVLAIADQVGRTPAQTVLRWHVQAGRIVFPKSQNPARLAENLDLFDFELTPAQMASLDALDRGHRTGPDPAAFWAKED